MTPSQRIEAARGALAVGPVRPRALLELSGADARDYLHRMCTQDVRALAPGDSAHLALLTPRGHLVGEGQVLVGEGSCLLDLDPAAGPACRELLERFVIMDDVAVEDRSARLEVLPLLGPGAAAAAAPGARRVLHRRRGAPAVDLIVGAGEAGPLAAALAVAGAVALDDGDLEALRILGGIARWGREMDGARLPMEVGLTADAISFSKGCYPGQEVVLRATVRGQVQRGLVQLGLPPATPAGAVLRAGGVEVGVVTSVAETPAGWLGLGLVRRAWWAPGTALDLELGAAIVRRAIAGEAEASAPGESAR